MACINNETINHTLLNLTIHTNSGSHYDSFKIQHRNDIYAKKYARKIANDYSDNWIAINMDVITYENAIPHWQASYECIKETISKTRKGWKLTNGVAQPIKRR